MCIREVTAQSIAASSVVMLVTSDAPNTRTA